MLAGGRQLDPVTVQLITAWKVLRRLGGTPPQHPPQKGPVSRVGTEPSRVAGTGEKAVEPSPGWGRQADLGTSLSCSRTFSGFPVPTKSRPNPSLEHQGHVPSGTPVFLELSSIAAHVRLPCKPRTRAAGMHVPCLGSLVSPPETPSSACWKALPFSLSGMILNANTHPFLEPLLRARGVLEGVRALGPDKLGLK